jgi:TonB-dependent starch-binding outer membrane protein SusC
MKLNLQKTIYMLSKYFLYGFVIQMLVFNFVLATNVNGQYKSIDEVQVRIEKRSGTLIEFFRAIEGQTSFNFLYDHNQVDDSISIQLKRKTGTVESFLKEVAVQAKLSFRQVNNSIDTKPVKATDQPVVLQEVVELVEGTVIDENGEPLPGVSILIKGTSTGTVTDIDGKYSLEINDENAVLVFSFIGYLKKEIAIEGRTVLNVKLDPDVGQLSEVVVIGYGQQERRDITGSVSSLKAAEFEGEAVASFSQGMQGKIAGVNITTANGAPGGNMIVRIRGNNSVLGSNDPLYVVDGFPIQDGGGGSRNFLNTINPSDIESIEVLKDASATAIYGSRGSNGVIIITTKQGKGDRHTIDFETSIGVQGCKESWT